MHSSGKLNTIQRIVILCIACFALGITLLSSAQAKDEITKKEEPAKQSGSFLIKFKPNVSEVKIQEVADFYGSDKVSALSSAEASTHKDPDQWRKLKFDSVDNLKDIARRILQDIRVDVVE